MPLRRYFSTLLYYDWILFFSTLLLLSFGLAALYGIATGFDEPDFLNFKKQIIFAAVGFCIMLAVSFFNYRIFSSYATLLYVAGGLILLFVLVFGTTLRGTRGWLELGGITFQPVEFAKLCLLAVLAKMFSSKTPEQKNFLFLLKTGALAFLYCLFVLIQPDFGSAVLLFFLWFGFLLFSGIDKKYIIGIVCALAIACIAGWMFFFQDYQKERIQTFFQPTKDPLGSGYHVRQSMIAIGSGGILGKGLASGSQSQLKFIPASQTDFIFAVISEELGLVGSAAVLVLYVIIFLRILAIARKIKDDFAAYLAIGITILFFVQSLINIGMNLGIMPVTGIGLPFLSYGGSFLLLSFFLIGIVESIAARTVKYKV